MKTLKIVLFSAFILIAFTSSAAQKRKVLIIGIDGVRSDALQQANTPNIDALIATGFYTWDAWHCGITVSGPSWSTIMTGVWWNKHGVKDNSYQNSNFDQYPYFTTRAKELLPTLRCVQVVEWPPLKDAVYNASWDQQYQTPDHNGLATEQAAVAEIQTDADVDVLFVYFDQVDGVGHSLGFDPNLPAYIQSIEDADTHVGAIVNAVKNRPTYAVEDWLILVTTDHGGLAKSHGGNSYAERHIWWIASGISVTHKQLVATEDPGTYNTLIIGIYDSTGVNDSILKLTPVQADIAVTALHHIIYDTGVNPEERADWDLDGKSWLNEFTTGIATTPAENRNIQVYPNPSTGIVTLWFENQSHNLVSAKVFDMSGKLVKSLENRQVANKINIDLSEQCSGQYIVQLQIGEQTITRKVELN